MWENLTPVRPRRPSKSSQRSLGNPQPQEGAHTAPAKLASGSLKVQRYTPAMTGEAITADLSMHCRYAMTSTAVAQADVPIRYACALQAC